MKGKASKVYNFPDSPLATFSSREGIDPTTLPFQEWSDQDIRTENWNAIGKTVLKSESSIRFRKSVASQTHNADSTEAHFEDEQVIGLPYSILAYEWKTAAQVFPDAKLEVYVDSYEYPDLISGNKHLLHSEFMRSFISSVYILTYLGNTTQFAIEYVSPNFMPTTGDSPWRPWHHIYSNSSAGTREDHDPTVNQIGKYVVRLFWLGTWRKIYVDDRLPVDMLNHVLLPSVTIAETERTPKEARPSSETKSKSSRAKSSTAVVVKTEEKVVPLWPFLLSKALLKIASLSWYEDREIIDFDIIQCLTGWLPQKINMKGIPASDIWQICWSNTDHFAYPIGAISKSDKSKKSETGSKIGNEEMKNVNTSNESSYPCYVVARCNDLRDLLDEDELSIFPCWTHDFLVHQTRDIPLVKPTITADLQSWKRIRWLDWVAEKGMVTGEELLPEIKTYKLVSPFRKVSEHVIYRQPSKISLHRPSMPKTIVLETNEKTEKKAEGKGKTKEKESQKDEKSSKGSKKSTKTVNEMKNNRNILSAKSNILDPSFWIDHNKLSHQINALTVYYKPSEFKAKVELTNLDQKKEKKDWQTVLIPPEIRKFRNEPIYIFNESIDSKIIAINFSQAGFTDILYPKKGTDKPTIAAEQFTECDFCLASLVKRVKCNITKEEVKDYVSVVKPQPSLVTHNRPISHLVLEEYSWTSDQLGNIANSMNSYGNKVAVIDLGPGRKIFKLWIKSDVPFVAHIFSDTTMVVGGIESVLFCMSEESQLLEARCIEIANSFGKLVEAFCTPKFLAKLRNFYSSYKPREYLTKTESMVVHNTFLNLLCEFVENNLNKKELYALKILLFRWQFPPRFSYPEDPDLCNCYEEEDFEYLKLTERYVVKIQSFFRGIYERSLMEHHKLSHPGNSTINESLLIIYAAIFSLGSRFVKCPKLVRCLTAHPAMKKIQKKYEFYKDLDNVLTLKQFSNALKVGDSQWSFICRQQFYITSTDPVPIKINLFCNLDQYVVRVIDNDNGNEIRRYTNNVTTYVYKTNLKGYTVLCYAWSASPQNLRYKLSFAMKKELESDRVIFPTFNTETLSFQGMYVPNENNNICKYLISVCSECALLSIYFVTSYDNVIIHLKLFDDEGKLLQNTIGKGKVLLPAILLVNQNKPTSAYTADDLKQTSSVSSYKKKSKTALKSQTLESKSRVSLQIKKSRLKSLDRLPGVYESPRLPSSPQSARSFIPPYYQKSEIKDKDKVLLDKPVVYRLEVNVLDDSWPLNAEEWSNLESGTCVELPVPQLKESGVQDSPSERRESLTPSSRSGKQRHPVLKPSNTSKLCLQNPYWMLDVIRNKSEYVEVVKDTKRENDLMEMKLKWWENDFTRMSRSQNLRTQFLEEYEIPNPDRLEDDGPTVRSLVKTDFAAKVLPPLDLNEYMIKDPEEVKGKRRMKTSKERDLDNRRDEVLQEEAENVHKKRTEKMEKFTEKQKENIQLMNDWFSEVRQESHQMMTHAMQIRTSCIHALLAAKKKSTEKDTAGKADKKEKKDKNVKKSKKDKKG